MLQSLFWKASMSSNGSRSCAPAKQKRWLSIFNVALELMGRERGEENLLSCTCYTRLETTFTDAYQHLGQIPLQHEAIQGTCGGHSSSLILAV